MSYLIISFASGFLLSLAFPRGNLFPLAWFAVAPLMYFTYRSSWRMAAFSGLAFGMGFFTSLLYWIGIFGRLPWFALALYQSLFIVAFVVGARTMGSRVGLWGRLLLLPALWTAVEWVRSLGMLGFTWGDLGYSQHNALPVVQIASVGGVWSVSFLLALSNAALSNVITAFRDLKRPRVAIPQFAVVVIVVLGATGFGMWALRAQSGHDGRPVRAAILQGDINQDIGSFYQYAEETWGVYGNLMDVAARRGAQLVVWPETTVPGTLNLDPYLQARLLSMANSARAKMLVGGWSEKEGKSFNSAFLMMPGKGLAGEYSKVHLVPFGEFVPARRYLPFLQHYRVRAHDTSPGRDYHTLDTGDYKLGTAICFESTFPYVLRLMTASGADLLCVITDDEWFGRTSAAEQHMTMSVLRAVENRRYLLRGAATGISCLIDPTGRITDRLPLWNSGAIVGDVRLRTERTPYSRYGDWVVYVSIAVVLTFAVIAIRRRITE